LPLDSEAAAITEAASGERRAQPARLVPRSPEPRSHSSSVRQRAGQPCMDLSSALALRPDSRTSASSLSETVPTSLAVSKYRSIASSIRASACSGALKAASNFSVNRRKSPCAFLLFSKAIWSKEFGSVR
jgi:predicted secreted protein